MSAAAVDFVVNCWEQTWTRVLSPGFVKEAAATQRYPFARRVVIVNNVDDVDRVRAVADSLRAAGEIDDVFFVADHRDDALAIVGLDRADLGRISHYSDWALVALTRPGSEWLVHWDADAELVSPGDWVTPALETFERDPQIMVANPAWSIEGARAESERVEAGFAIGFGFSDQVFLARRAEFARPIYRERHVASLRYPLAHIAPTFECRVDAHMRVHGRRRATHLGIEYRHHGSTGAAYPQATWIERLRRRAQRYRLARYRSRNPSR